MPAFSLEKVTRYRTQPGPDGSPCRMTVLQEVTAEIPDGGLCLLMGPSGSGKSTLLRLLNRLDDPDTGEIRIDGAPLTRLPVLELRRRVAMVGQQPAPFASSVADNLEYGPKLMGLSQAERATRAREAIRQVGLDEGFLTRQACRLSVGQQQRVCLARALALRPEALLLDEPTAALDPHSARVIVELVRGLQQDLRLTVVYVTHRRDEAEALGGRVLLLVDGSLAEEGETRAVLGQPRSDGGRRFLSPGARAESPR